MIDLNQYIGQLNREKEETDAQNTARRLGLSYFVLTGYEIGAKMATIFTDEEIENLQIIPYLRVGDELKIGVVDPENDLVNMRLQALATETGLRVIPVKITASSFHDAIPAYREAKEKMIQDQNLQIQTKLRNQELTVDSIEQVAGLVKRASISDLLDIVVKGASALSASDIHMEPRESDFVIRYRIDGILMDVVILPSHTHYQILSRIKFLCSMKMDVQGKPQDGGFTINIGEGKKVDLRVSVMPSNYGEAIVIRVMGQEGSLVSLDEFGFRADALVAIKEAVSKPHGMILTSGPTGSGKSSTMYAIITYLRKPNVKIITLENPVEYKIEGIEQSPVHPGDGYEFADGLRASLRQDPDILMVGEIRDVDTAEISIQAALTGHLLLSTIHANSAPSVYIRLLDIGVKPYLLSGSINLIMAQRLIRKVCPDCREEYVPTPEEWARVKSLLIPIEEKLAKSTQDLINTQTPKLCRGKGCDKCHQTGYKGRQVIVEYLVPDEKIEALVSQGSSLSGFDTIAREMGMISMQQDGFIKVAEGISTIEEVERVTKE